MQRAFVSGLVISASVFAAHGMHEAHAEIDHARAVCTWDQWGGGADHEGEACIAAQPPVRELAHIVYDPFDVQEIAEAHGVLLEHYPTPLIDGDEFYMLQKAGTYTSCNPPGTRAPGCGSDRANILNQIWTERAYRFEPDGSLRVRWTFTSDWKPAPNGGNPMFQAALSGPFLYVPGAGGTVFQVLKQTGQVLQRIKPFPTIDPNIFVIGGITIDRFGVAYWNAVRTDPVTRQHTGFIIAAVPWGATKVVAYDGLIPDAPAATDLCFSDFSSSGTALPWPPPGQVPDQVVCGPQRPGLQVTPAIGADGTVFTATRADGQANYSYIVALHPDLTLKWATSLRGLVNDGCFLEAGLPLVGPDVFCPPGTPVGIDPLTGMAPAQQTEDASSGAPVVLPDGGVLFGAMRDYDDGRGILLKFDRHGRFAAHYDFGWDTTPAVYRHDGTYSVITKDNHYGDLVPLFGPFYMTQLSSELVPEWRFENTSTEMCSFDGSGTLVCTPNDPLSIGYEWCVNAPVVDRDGDVIATNEDGSLYVIGQGGTLKSKVFLNQALGSVYTPAAVDSRGRIFALNNGELSVFGGR